MNEHKSRLVKYSYIISPYSRCDGFMLDIRHAGLVRGTKDIGGWINDIHWYDGIRGPVIRRAGSTDDNGRLIGILMSGLHAGVIHLPSADKMEYLCDRLVMYLNSIDDAVSAYCDDDTLNVSVTINEHR